VVVVVPHREREGEDSGRGFVVREATLGAKDSLDLPLPYRGAPVVQMFDPADRAAADRLADQMSGLAPKKRIGRSVAAKRIAEALARDGWAVVLKPSRARPGQPYFVDAHKGLTSGTVTLDGDGAVSFWRDFDGQSAASRQATEHVQQLVLYTLKGDEAHPSADPRAKKIARKEAAETIAKALRKAGWEATVSWDIERPGEAVNIRATNGNRTGHIAVRYDGGIELDGAFGAASGAIMFAQDLVDEALQGAEPDPALNPPAQRRAAIPGWEAALELAELLEGQRDELGGVTEVRRITDWRRDRELPGIDVGRVRPHPTLGGDHRLREPLGRVRFLDNGGVEYLDFSAEQEARMRDALARALDGRTIVPKANGA
jgi:hypothetical protein